MADMQALLGDTRAAKAQPTFTWRQHTFRLHQTNGAIMAKFVQWAKRYAKCALLEDRDLYTDEEWQAKLREYEERKVSGYFDWVGPYCTALRASQDGRLTILRFQLGEAGQDLTDTDMLLMAAESPDLDEAMSQYAVTTEALYELAGYKKVRRLVSADGQQVPERITALLEQLERVRAHKGDADPRVDEQANFAEYVLADLVAVYGGLKEVDAWEGGDPKKMARLMAEQP